MRRPACRALAWSFSLVLVLLAGCASPPPCQWIEAAGPGTADLRVLAGCAALPPTPAPPPPPLKSYVVLLPNADGSVGQVNFSSPTSTPRVLSQPLQAADLADASAPYLVSRETVERDFGPALAARPGRPEQFLLYFEIGGAVLTEQSRALLSTIVERLRARSAADLSVVGHTDTQGRPEANEALGLERATSVAQQLRQLGVGDVPIAVESHGPRNLLVPTPDQTAEPRNRRVEVTLR
jgi:outer membrane protein OmpA-like peptidoglycan-associated protein